MSRLLAALTDRAVSPRGKYVVLVAWLLLVGGLGAQAGRLPALYDQSLQSQVPSSAPSQQATALARHEFPEAAATPALIVLTDPGGLSLDDRRAARAFSGWLVSRGGLSGVVSVYVTPQAGADLISADGTTMEIVALLSTAATEPATARFVAEARQQLATVAADGSLRAYVTGPAAIAVDATAVFRSIDLQLLIATTLLVLVLLVVLYRSPILPLAPLLAVGLVLVVVQGLLALAAARGLFPVGQMAASVATVLLFGAGTDYTLFIVARYREELRHEPDRHLAMRTTMRAVAEAIASSAGAVLLAMLTLLLAGLALYSSLGWVLATAMVAMLLAGLTLIPALLVLIGRAAFWPFVPRAGDPQTTAEGLWLRIGYWVAGRPRTAAGVGVAALAVLALGNLAAQQSYSLLGAFRAPTGAAAGYDVLRAHMPPGAIDPTTVLIRVDSAARRQAAIADAAAAARSLLGVSAVGRPAVSADGSTVQLSVTFADDPYGTAALDRVQPLHDAVARALARDGVAGTVLVGGQTAALADTRMQSRRDTVIVVLAVLLVVGLVLVLLLRSLVAPLFLLGVLALNFLAVVGVAGLLTPLNYAIPLYTFVFLVSLGADYTIFLMSRVREEVALRGPVEGVAHAVGRTGGVISSAGLILAGTFSALAGLPLTVLFQLGASVAAGVLLDTFLVRPLIVPGLTLGLGRWAWWPVR